MCYRHEQIRRNYDSISRSISRGILLAVLLGALLVVFTGCGKDSTTVVVFPTPTATPTPVVTRTPFPPVTDPGCYAPPDHPDACDCK